MGIYGEDWSSYQSDEPSTRGLSFAFVKITEGLTHINPKWPSQRDRAKADGLVWGGYHYPHMANSAQEEADFFLSQVPWQPGDAVILGWDGYGYSNVGVSWARQLAYKEDWIRHVKDRMPRNPVGVYCNRNYLRNVDTTGNFGDFLWITTLGRAPDDPGIKAPWLFHQFTDTPIDTGYCHLDDLDALRSWALSFAHSVGSLGYDGHSRSGVLALEG
ncbi:glycoside hydrolase family 25 protein [Streptomyces sp. NPDC092307]|uniref:glycoside hydrolase family 25 protein n=1 Tax=Streptomyces sp. NPDC092307 TaxID=3366013 RepID=UPI0037FE8322